MTRTTHSPAARAAFLLGLPVMLLSLAVSAQAHLLNMTRATLAIDAGGELSLAFDIDLTRAFDDRAAYHAASLHPDPLADSDLQALAQRLTGSVHLDTERGPWRGAWRLAEFSAERADAGRYADPFHWPMTRLRFVADAPLRATSLRVHFDDSFPIEEPVALTIEAIIDDARSTRWLVVDQRSPRFDLDGAAPATRATPAPAVANETSGVNAPVPARSFLAYAGAARAGFAHILPGGLDHVLFVALLVLLCRRPRATLAAVTLFTVAHGVTLTLVLLHWVPRPPALVEPLILASIAWLAVDLLRGARWGRRHAVLVFGFGLIHGLGFANALAGLALDPDALAANLVALNIGVEGAQLVVAAAALALLTAIDAARLRRPLLAK